MLRIIRYSTSDHGTFGVLIRPDGFVCHSLELPQRDNKPNISCIPAGRYELRYLERSASGRYRHVYHLQGVYGRSGVLIHAGNLAGDVTKDLRTHSAGCILLGAKRGVLSGQQAVLSSGPTLTKLMATRETELESIGRINATPP